MLPKNLGWNRSVLARLDCPPPPPLRLQDQARGQAVPVCQPPGPFSLLAIRRRELGGHVRREVLSESRMREICLSGSMSGSATGTSRNMVSHTYR